MATYNPYPTTLPQRRKPSGMFVGAAPMGGMSVPPPVPRAARVRRGLVDAARSIPGMLTLPPGSPMPPLNFGQAGQPPVGVSPQPAQAGGIPPMQTMLPMDAALGMRQGTYQSPTFLPQTVKQQQSAGFFSMSPAAQAAAVGGANAIGDQGYVQNRGVPGGYAQAGVNPGFGDRTGLAVHRAPLPRLNQLGAVADPVQAARDLAAQRATASDILRQESGLPVATSSLTQGLSPAEWRSQSKERIAAAMRGEALPEVGPWRGRMGERNLSTTELLQQKAEDNPEGPEAAMLARMRGRFDERRASFQLPLEERRELLAQKRTGMSKRQREIAMGLRMTPEEFAADQQRQAYEAQAIGMGIAGTGEGPLGLQRGQAGEIGSAIRGGLPTTREVDGRIPAAERKRVQKDLFPDDATGYVEHMIEGGMSPEEAAADAVSRYDLDRSWLQQFYEGISRGISPDIEILSPEEMLLLERDANAGDAAAKKRLKEEKTKQWAQWVSGIGGAVGAGIRDRAGRMLGFIK